jgi:hypothetical protein
MEQGQQEYSLQSNIGFAANQYSKCTFKHSTVLYSLEENANATRCWNEAFFISISRRWYISKGEFACL